MKRNLLFILVALLPVVASAYDAKIGDIYYNFSGVEATVTSQKDYWMSNKGSAYSGDVVIPSSVTYNGTTYSVTGIGSYAFDDCSGLTSVTIPNSVTSIGSSAFSGCTGLTSVNIPDGVNKIDYYTFFHCSSLTTITIPNSVTSIVECAFIGCSGLTSVTIPNNVTSIGYGAFAFCSSLTSINIPNSVTNIGDGAFSDCSSLTSITIPNSVTSIGNDVFSDCSSLTSVTIPNSLTRISSFAFSGCSSLTSVTIPNSVTSIGSYAFCGCSGLTSVTIGSSVQMIGYEGDRYRGYTFANCQELTDVYCYAENVPSTRNDAFEDSYIENATLHVPAGSVEKYKSTAPWSEFGNIVAIEQPVTFTAGQVATIILPTEPDASKGMYFRLDRWEDGKIAFEQELQPKARTPYIIVPNEDFSIDTSTMDLTGLRPDTATIEGVYFIGWYVENKDYGLKESTLDFILDTTPDCYYNQEGLSSIHVGPLRACFSILWRLCKNWEWKKLEYILYSADGTKVITEEPVVFTAGQMASIILPTAPDAGKGKYYRLDKCEDGKIIFEQEKQPQAHIPYIIVPSEDFSIDPSTLDLAGLSPDTVSIAGIHFIGSYSREEPVCQEGWYIDIIDTTPDCKAEEGKAYTIGALRAYLTVNWDDPINHSGSKGPGDKLEIVLKDNGTSLTPPLSKGEGDEIVNGKWSNGKWFDLQGRELSGKPAKGVYINDGKKFIAQ